MSIASCFTDNKYYDYPPRQSITVYSTGGSRLRGLTIRLRIKLVVSPRQKLFSPFVWTPLE
jgi:hypothetical protein